MKNQKVNFNFPLLLLILLAAAFTFSACKPEEPDEQPPAQQTDQSSEVSPDSQSSMAYPEPENVIVEEAPADSGYPITETEEDDYEQYPDSIAIPSPSSDMGIVTGRLLSAGSQAPYLAPGLYLGHYLQPDVENEDLPQAMSLTTEVDPKAIQAKDGIFIFLDVEPGQYGLIIWTPMNLILVSEVSNPQLENIFIVTAGEITDLGTIIIE